METIFATMRMGKVRNKKLLFLTNYSASKGCFLIFFTTFVLSFNFMLLLNSATNASVIFDMANFLATCCWPETSI